MTGRGARSSDARTLCELPIHFLVSAICAASGAVAARGRIRRAAQPLECVHERSPQGRNKLLCVRVSQGVPHPDDPRRAAPRPQRMRCRSRAVHPASRPWQRVQWTGTLPLESRFSGHLWTI